MMRRWPLAFMSTLALWATGCALSTGRAGMEKMHDPPKVDSHIATASHQPPPPHESPHMAQATAPAPPAPELSGPQPVDVYIRRALAQNRAVQAARFNVMSLKARIPQVTALEDPILSNSIFPIPAVAPQYSLMGYGPYSGLIAQQLPWFGTLRLRGEVAEGDAQVALMELAAAQLDTVAAVKSAYYDLYFNQRAEAILLASRALIEDFLRLARERARTATATQVDVLRAETAISDIDRELEATAAALATARAELTRQLHVSPETDFRTLPEVPVGSVPTQIEQLYQLAVASRPDLRGRLAAIARDEKAIALARKRYYPNVTTGFIYEVMTERGSEVGQAAGGMPNIGMFIGFNLPIYRKKIAAGVVEAQARAAAEAELYRSERDQAHRDVKDLFTQALTQQNVLGILRRVNLPNAEQVLKLTASEFTAGNLDLLSLITAQREQLQVQLQIAQVESELGKALAALERAVGVQLNESPPAALSTATNSPLPPPPDGPGPFEHREEHPISDASPEPKGEEPDLPLEDIGSVKRP